MKVKFLVFIALFGLGSLYASDWGYDAEHGPKKWGQLNPEYKECEIGKAQSPIDIPTNNAKKVKNELVLNYKSDSNDITNNGHSVQINFTKNSEITFKGKKYQLLQTHFHTPAENKIDGKAYPLEMHLVHQSDDGKLLVIGVLFEEGKSNAELQKIITAAPKEVGNTINLKNIEIASILPKSKAYYAFDGSLTTPPCSENVQWIVLKNPAQGSKQQIQNLHEILNDDEREVQALNGREIEFAE